MKKNSNFPPEFKLKNGIHEFGVTSTKNFNKGEILFKLKGKIINHPTRTSIQIGENSHIEDSIGSFLNHSCSPSARVDRNLQALVALKDIKKGDEITFDYNMNEDLLSNPFTCECCGRKIEGKRISEKIEYIPSIHLSIKT